MTLDDALPKTCTSVSARHSMTTASNGVTSCATCGLSPEQVEPERYVLLPLKPLQAMLKHCEGLLRELEWSSLDNVADEAPLIAARQVVQEELALTLNPNNDEMRVRTAIEHLRAARDLLKAADAPRTLDRVRLALTSAYGAERNASCRKWREKRVEQAAIS